MANRVKRGESTYQGSFCSCDGGCEDCKGDRGWVAYWPEANRQPWVGDYQVGFRFRKGPYYWHLAKLLGNQ